MKRTFYLSILFLTLAYSCTKEKERSVQKINKQVISKQIQNDIPEKNRLIVETVQNFGPGISPTYEEAVCTELVIQVLEKVQPLDAVDKKRIRIITKEDIQTLLKNNSKIPKGVYYSLMEKGVGTSIDDQNEVLEGDFVQFWTETWGHCGIVKSIDLAKNEMQLYSSFPSTDGYGIQKFNIPEHVYFVRLK